MKRLFILSEAHCVISHIVTKIDFGEDKKILLITTSTERKDPESLDWFKKDKKAYQKAGISFVEYSITGKTKQELESDLSGYSHIHVAGGDVSWLVEQAYRSGFVDVIKDLVENKGVTYIGSSAAAILCGPVIPPYYDLDKDYFSEDLVKGLGLVDFCLVPHWGRDGRKEKYLDIRLPQIFNESMPPIVMLNDNQYIQVEADSFKIIDTKKQ